MRLQKYQTKAQQNHVKVKKNHAKLFNSKNEEKSHKMTEKFIKK